MLLYELNRLMMSIPADEQAAYSPLSASYLVHYMDYSYRLVTINQRCWYGPQTVCQPREHAVCIFGPN